MADLIVVTGPPGAGKSTVSRALSSRFNPSARVLGDSFFAFVDKGYLAPWTAAAHAQNETVTCAAAAAAGRFVAGGYTVVYDGVVGPWLLDTFGNAAGITQLRYAMLLPTEDECVERVRSRSGHGFTDLDATRHMYQDFVNARIDDRHALTDSISTEALTSSIYERILAGTLIYTIDDAAPLL